MGRLVYSTDQGRLCPSCGHAVDQCQCRQEAKSRIPGGDGIVRIQRETKGRKGKGVTLITGLPLAEPEMKQLARELKQRCGTGGAVKNGIIEIQGDQRELLKEALQTRGYTVKLSGG